MLNATQKKAVRLLFELPEERVAETLGLRISTLRRWKGKAEFISAMQAISEETHQAASRITSRTLAHAAAQMFELVAVDAQGSRPDPKIMVDLLKAGGAIGAAGAQTEKGSPFGELIEKLAGIQETLRPGSTKR